MATYGKVEGWCFGVWGEASDDIHSLIQNMVTSRLQVIGQQPGRFAEVQNIDGLKSQLVGSLRRQISLTAVRANARILISRMESHVGKGALEAAKRRQAVTSIERAQYRERRAQALSAGQGRNIVRRGCFRLD